LPFIEGRRTIIYTGLGFLWLCIQNKENDGPRGPRGCGVAMRWKYLLVTIVGKMQCLLRQPLAAMEQKETEGAILFYSQNPCKTEYFISVSCFRFV